MPKPGLEVELDDLVRRMIAAVPERRERIHEYAGRLRRAFLGRDTHAQTKSAQAGRRGSLMWDDIVLIEIALDLAEEHGTDGDLLAHGLSGKIREALKRSAAAGHKGVPRWSAKTIRRKLIRRVRKLEEEMP